MKTHPSISRFTEREQNDLQAIAKKIVDEMAPLAIYYYGSRAVHEIRRSYFTSHRDHEQWRASYHLLVIVDDRGLQLEESHDFLLAGITGQVARASMMIHSRGFVQEELLKGNFFFSRILHASVRLYDRARGFRQTPRPLRLVRSFSGGREIRQRYPYYMWEADERLKEATDFLRRDAAYDSVICLRHCLQYILRAVIIAGTGYDIGSHDWQKLLRFAESFTKVPAVFSTVSPEESRLYHLVSRPEGQPDPLGLKITGWEAATLLRRGRLLKAWAESFLRSNDTLLNDRQMKD